MDFRVAILQEGDVWQRARLNTEVMPQLKAAQTVVERLQAGDEVVCFPDEVFCAAEVRLGAPGWAKTFGDEYDDLYFTLSLKGSKEGAGIFLVGMALPNIPSDEDAEAAAENIVIASQYAPKYVAEGHVEINESEYHALDLSNRAFLAIDRAGVTLVPTGLLTNDPDPDVRAQFAVDLGTAVGAALLLAVLQKMPVGRR